MCPGNSAVHENAVQKVNNPIACSLCETVMKELDSILGKNSTQAEIEAALDRVCGYIPSVETECRQYVAEYTPLIINLLARGLSPLQVCTTLGLCPGGQTIPNVADLKNVGSVKCFICKFLFNVIKSVLKMPETRNSLKEALAIVCKYVPWEDCNVAIGKIVDYVLNQLDANFACGLLKLCPKSTNAVPITDLKGAECGLCTFAISELDSYLKDKTVRAEIKGVLDQACHLLPPADVAECQRFFDGYLDMALDMIIKTQPRKLCTMLHVCPADRVFALRKPNDMECTLCTEGVTYLYNLLKDKSVVEMIENALERICDFMPSVRKQCVSYIQTYLQYIIDMLENMESPKQLCQQIHMCPASRMNPFLNYRKQSRFVRVMERN